MLKLNSELEGKIYNLYELEKLMKPLGYVIGGNWDYDHGCFDYKIDDEVGYQFLRIPFKAVNGQLDSNGVTVELQKPFLLSHKYQIGLDDNADAGVFSGSFNQFSEPVDADATFPEQYVGLGKALVQELEKILLV